MRRPPQPPTNPLRLRQAIQRRLQLDAVCHSCHHRTTLDPTELMLKVGENFPVPRLNGRLRCSACHSKRAEILILPRARPMAPSAPAKAFR